MGTYISAAFPLLLIALHFPRASPKELPTHVVARANGTHGKQKPWTSLPAVLSVQLCWANDNQPIAWEYHEWHATHEFCPSHVYQGLSCPFAFGRRTDGCPFDHIGNANGVLKVITCGSLYCLLFGLRVLFITTFCVHT